MFRDYQRINYQNAKERGNVLSEEIMEATEQNTAWVVAFAEAIKWEAKIFE